MIVQLRNDGDHLAEVKQHDLVVLLNVGRMSLSSGGTNMYLNKLNLGSFLRRLLGKGRDEALKEMSAKEGKLRAMLEHAVALCVLDPTCRKCCEEAMAGSGGAGRSVFNDSEEAFTWLCALGPEQLSDEELLDLVVDPEALASVSEVLIGGSGDDVWLLELLHKNAVGNDPEKIDERIFEDLMPAGPMPKWLRNVAQEYEEEAVAARRQGVPADAAEKLADDRNGMAAKRSTKPTAGG